MHKPRVVYWNSQPTPYMVDRWNAVASRGNIDMRAWFNVERESDRSWDVDEREWLFKGSYIVPRRILGREFYLPVKELERDRPDLLVQDYGNPSAVLGLHLARPVVPRIAIRLLPSHGTWFPRTRVKESIKRHLHSSVDAMKTPGPDGMKVLGNYNFPRERTFTVTQSIDVEHYAKARDIPEHGRTRLREELGIKGCTFLYVGRLWEKKGLDVLFEAYAHVAAGDTECSLLIVGDGIDEQRFRTLARDLPNVVFTGFKQKSQLPQYYAVADVFVFPTLGDPHGLVVDEAMAAGLPVISSDAAGDIRERVPEGEAGYVVPAGDAPSLAERMKRVASSASLRAALSEGAIRSGMSRGPQRYAEDFERFVDGVLALPIRRTPSTIIASAVGRGMAWVLR